LKIISIIIPRSFQRNGNWIPITHWWLVVTGGSSFSRWPPEPIFRLQLDAKYQPSFVCFFFNCCFKSTIMKKKKKKGNQRCCTYLLSQFVFCLSNKRVPFNRPLSRWHLPPAPSKKERKKVCVCVWVCRSRELRSKETGGLWIPSTKWFECCRFNLSLHNILLSFCPPHLNPPFIFGYQLRPLHAVYRCVCVYVVSLFI